MTPALDAPIKGTWTGNIGSGHPTTVLEVAQLAAEAIGREVSTRQEGAYRPDDIRHLWLDVAEARHALGFEPLLCAVCRSPVEDRELSYRCEEEGVTWEKSEASLLKRPRRAWK